MIVFFFGGGGVLGLRLAMLGFMKVARWFGSYRSGQLWPIVVVHAMSWFGWCLGSLASK